MPNLALFDLDGTLLSGDSDFEWGEYLSGLGVVDGDDYRAKNEYFFAQYREGVLDINEYLQFALRPLADHPQGQLLDWRHNFVEERIKPMVKARAHELTDKHKNDTKIIITSTNRFVTTPIAHLFQVDALIATEPTVYKNTYTAAADEPACFRENKIIHLKRWLADTQTAYDRIWCYSDSINDLPLLEYVDTPVVVDGDDALTKHARKHNWAQINLA